MKILLVDDNTALRRVLRQALDNHAAFEVVGEARDGADAVRLAERLDPDIVLMDVRMPVMDGVEATRRIRRAHPRTRIVALSSSADLAPVARMLAAGASGYVVKGEPIERIAAAVTEAHRGPRLADFRRVVDGP